MAVAESLAHHGFKTIAIIPSHGWNFVPLAELQEETGGVIGGARFLAFSDLMGFIAVMTAVGEADGIDAGVIGAHTGEGETSLVLAAREELAQLDFAIEGYVGDFGEEAAANIFSEGMPALTDNGILGDARPADRGRGF